MVNPKVKQWATMVGCGMICGLMMWIGFSAMTGIDVKAFVGAMVGGAITGALMQLMT